MEKWEKELKKDANSPMPDLVNHRIEETLKHLRRRNPGRKMYVGLAAAAAAIALSLGISMVSPAVANTLKELPVVGSAFEFVGNIGQKKGQEAGLATELGEQVEIDGQVVTFTETMYDGGDIHVGYIRESMGSRTSSHFLGNLEFSIEKGPVSSGMGGKETEIEEGVHAGTVSLRFQEEIPDSFTLVVRPREGRSWVVKLPVEKKGSNRVFPIKKKKETEDLAIVYDRLTFFPTSTELAFSLVMDEKALEDNTYDWLSYQVVDNKGRVLEPFSTGGGGGGPVKGKVTHAFTHSFEPVDDLPEFLIIRPYLDEFKETTPELIKKKWEGKQVTLSQGGIGSITVLQAEERNGAITFTYETDGDDAYSQANAFWLEDSAGNRYDPAETPVRVEGTTNQYQASFSGISDLEDMNLATVTKNPIQYLKELEIKIDLKEKMVLN
ncbi:hypothetical protein WQ57_02015 [Mesobacillus campisalis]|uniref:DUF4179 domain-containing protein n=1 Tax=Mesobacillus campisalis TaxID=1408103 RepID=A0A0M2T0V4_9BACI|nr:DUF4179 domain-containing protein [Mesobacillus campisalis]KKK40058.1 hypothetical protein WQ57_02015 [Mesobacillus campisalis]